MDDQALRRPNHGPGADTGSVVSSRMHGCTHGRTLPKPPAGGGGKIFLFVSPSDSGLLFATRRAIPLHPLRVAFSNSRNSLTISHVAMLR